MPKLKVYRTPIGFHDAYVAAPSQKAALAAWGTTKNLFARGAAELVTDPKLTKGPLGRPGEIIKRARGSAAEHGRTAASAERSATAGKTPVADKAAKLTPRPSRKPLEKAEQALSAARKRHDRDLAAIDKRIDALRAKRNQLVRAQENEIGELEETRSSAEARYRRAIDDWEA